MDTIIIGQGYNLKEDTSVAKELIKQFNSHRYNSFTCLVAFASYGGVSALTKYILDGKRNGMSIRVILGIDQKGTSKEALEEVLSWGVDSWIYHTDARNIFHPKVYLFENEDIFTLIVGSNNLTVPGLVQNVECSLLIKDILSNSVHKEFYHYWKSFLSGSNKNLRRISKKLIDQLYSGGFVPQRHVTVKKTKKKGKKSRAEALYVGDVALIAEIGGGPRWKQVNFPVDVFEQFFGARRGDNSYQIELLNIAKDGTLGEVETRQAVSVKSRNYRFEIKCAETEGPYPGNDNRPIGVFVKLDSKSFVYQVLLPDHVRYKVIREYLYNESSCGNRELKRAIVHVEALHAIYPELVS